MTLNFNTKTLVYLFSSIVLCVIGICIARADNAVIITNLIDAIVESDNSSKDIILIFGSEYCGPCGRMKKDIMDNIGDFENYIICLIDIDKEQNKEIKREYRVRSIPDYLIMRRREEIKRRKGYSNIHDFKQWLLE